MPGVKREPTQAGVLVFSQCLTSGSGTERAVRDSRARQEVDKACDALEHREGRFHPQHRAQDSL